jgi:hypothetical protein
MSERESILNDRANDFVGFFLHGLGDTGDCAEAERTYRAFQDELCASTDHLFPNVSIDIAALEAWYQGQDDIPY